MIAKTKNKVIQIFDKIGVLIFSQYNCLSPYSVYLNLFYPSFVFVLYCLIVLFIYLFYLFVVVFYN